MKNNFAKWKPYIFLAILLLSLIPLIWLGRYNYPTGDDYYYGAETHLVWQQTGSIIQTLDAACAGVADSYQIWQGTYSALFLMYLAPNVFSNTAYLRKQVEFDSTVAAVNRIVMPMEQPDGYVVGQTPVAWVGDLSRSDAVVYRDGLGELRGYGVSGSYAIGHYRTVKPFFTQVMGYPLELVSQEEAEALAESDAVQAMPVFPNKGYCQVVDGIMVIRLSE